MDNTLLKSKNNYLIWSNRDNTNNLEIIEISEGKLLVKIIGIFNLNLTKDLFVFLNKYSDKLNKKVDIAIDNSNIADIEQDARLWVLSHGKKCPVISTAVSYGTNIYIENMLTILVNIISDKDSMMTRFKMEKEAIDYLTQS